MWVWMTVIAFTGKLVYLVGTSNGSTVECVCSSRSIHTPCLGFWVILIRLSLTVWYVNLRFGQGWKRCEYVEGLHQCELLDCHLWNQSRLSFVAVMLSLCVTYQREDFLGNARKRLVTFVVIVVHGETYTLMPFNYHI